MILAPNTTMHTGERASTMQFPNWYTWLLATLLVGFMVRLLYGSFFSSTEERVRSYLTKTTSARRTRRQERLLLQAIQGGADVSDSMNLAFLISFCILLAGLVVFTVGAVAEYNDKNIVEQLRIQGASAPLNAPSVDTLQVRHQDAVTEVRLARGTFLGLSAGALWMETYVISMVKTRREFDVWHQRMKQALFALASPDEIKTLVRIEAQVKTPLAVAAYLNYAITIAVALSIPEVTDPLDIWGLRAEMEKRRA